MVLRGTIPISRHDHTPRPPIDLAVVGRLALDLAPPLFAVATELAGDLELAPRGVVVAFGRELPRERLMMPRPPGPALLRLAHEHEAVIVAILVEAHERQPVVGGRPLRQ